MTQNSPARLVGEVRYPVRFREGWGEPAVLRERLLDEPPSFGTTCGAVEAKAREKLLQVDGKIAALRKLKSSLRRLVTACEAREPTSDCPILEELEER